MEENVVDEKILEAVRLLVGYWEHSEEPNDRYYMIDIAKVVAGDLSVLEDYAPRR